MNRVFALVLVVLSLAACEGPYRAKMQTWVGKSEGELVASMGAPSRIYDPGDGTRVLTYDEADTRGYVANGVGVMAGYRCSTSFAVSREHRVIGSAINGNACGYM